MGLPYRFNIAAESQWERFNGGGGAHTYALREKSPDLLFSREGHGFVGVHADKQTLAIDIFDATPRTLASYTIARACAAAPSQCLKAVRR